MKMQVKKKPLVPFSLLKTAEECEWNKTNLMNDRMIGVKTLISKGGEGGGGGGRVGVPSIQLI